MSDEGYDPLADDDENIQEAGQQNDGLEEDLFGDSPPRDEQEQDAGAADIEDDMGDEPGAGAGGNDGANAEDLFGSGAESDEDNLDAAADEPTGAPITVSAPLLQRPPAGKLLLLKVPNVIKFDPQPFDPDAYEGGVEEVVEKGKKRYRPCDINVMRWRYRQNDDGSLSKESNARYIQWSDGTESILLGDELLEMDRKVQPRANTYVHVVRYDAIQGLAHVKETVHLKPASLDSKLHQRLRMTVQRATQKTDKVQVHYAARNPEVEKAEAEKRAEDMAKLRRSQARVAERSRPIKPRVPAFNSAYIEADDEEEEPDYFAAGGDDEEEEEEEEDDYYRRRREDDEEAAAARLQSAKRSTPPPSSLRSAKQPRRPQPAEEEGEEEEEAVEAAKAAAGLKVRRGAIIDEDDDD